nr:NUDIX hydrolase [Gemmobacter straminiformis]
MFCGGRLLTYQRDDIAGLPWAGWWDLPGGGREGRESAEECVLREIVEEFGLTLSPGRLLFARVLPSMTVPTRPSVLFGGLLAEEEISAIRFGDEGQRWEMMEVAAFLAHGQAIPEMQRRAAMAWKAMGLA